MARPEREKPRPIGLGVVAAHVPDLHAVAQHRDGVRVIGVVGLGKQNGLDLDPYALVRAAADHSPERFLVLAPADHFEIVTSAEEHDVGGRWRHDECWHRRHCATVGAGRRLRMRSSKPMKVMPLYGSDPLRDLP